MDECIEWILDGPLLEGRAKNQYKYEHLFQFLHKVKSQCDTIQYEKLLQYFLMFTWQ